LADKVADLTASPGKRMFKDSEAAIGLHEGAQILGDGTKAGEYGLHHFAVKEHSALDHGNPGL
jgi:hypothetical protein